MAIDLEEVPEWARSRIARASTPPMAERIPAFLRKCAENEKPEPGQHLCGWNGCKRSFADDGKLWHHENRHTVPCSECETVEGFRWLDDRGLCPRCRVTPPMAERIKAAAETYATASLDLDEVAR